ncbi:MAG TPA: FAD:protein FMN transferase [Ktedonobacterales bacterium]
MATPFTVFLTVPEHKASTAMADVERYFEWVSQVSAALTRFSPDSELSRLNASAGRWQPVSDLLYDVLKESLAAATATAGLFDPALGLRMAAVGYDRDMDEIRENDQTAPMPAGEPVWTSGGWRAIELDDAQRRVHLPKGVALDFGGIAKGWVADVGLDRFFGRYANVLIDAGGDMAARGGESPGHPWPIAIGDPRLLASADQRHVAVLTLGAGGLATSGATVRWWKQGHRRQHHLLDPHTGEPMRLWVDVQDDTSEDLSLIASATAVAPSATQAEVAAKVALLRGRPQALATIEQAWKAKSQDKTRFGDGHVALLLVLGSGEVVCSSNFREHLATIGSEGELWLL